MKFVNHKKILQKIKICATIILLEQKIIKSILSMSSKCVSPIEEGLTYFYAQK